MPQRLDLLIESLRATVVVRQFRFRFDGKGVPIRRAVGPSEPAETRNSRRALSVVPLLLAGNSGGGLLALLKEGEQFGIDLVLQC